MKTLFLFIFLAFSAGVNAQRFVVQSTPDRAPAPIVKKKAEPPIRFSKTKQAFGTITKGKPVTAKFEFSNISKQPVSIEDIVATCGCIAPKFSRQPVLPNKKSVIEITYDAAKAGSFNKSVSVKFTGTGQSVDLTVTGTAK